MSASDAAFPRGTAPPRQSPLFWVSEKSRYLRQLVLRDLEARWLRRQLVYFTRCDTTAQIDGDDDRLLLELLTDCKPGDPIDLHLETNGGITDAAEKLISLLQPYRANLRVIVPRRAKSNGTLLALAAERIVMGIGSELGPIDPFIVLGPEQVIPAHFILNAPQVDPIIHQIATYAVSQTQQLATELLRSGQFADKPQHVEAVVAALSTRNTYPSHGSVIDQSEAVRLGLNVEQWSADSDDWRWVWILRCMYDYDSKQANLTKIFETDRLSNSVRAG